MKRTIARWKTCQSSRSESRHVSASNLRRELRRDRQTPFERFRMTLDASSHFFRALSSSHSNCIRLQYHAYQIYIQLLSRRHCAKQGGLGEEAGRVERGEWGVVGADDERDLGAAEYGGVAAALLH